MVPAFGILVASFAAAAAVAVTRAFTDVRRARVERFARRQWLVITPDNADLVIEYLATTRRWRATGLLAAVVAVAEYSALRGGVLRLDFAAAFVGWFAGALAAEWRVGARREDTATRRAALAPRHLTRYVPAVSRFVAALAVTLLVAVTALAVADAVTEPRRTWIITQIAVTVMVMLMVVLAGRRVLRRPQPAGPADLLAADEAIRARSLCVLTGSTIAIAGYLSAWLAATLDSADVAVFVSDSARPVIAIGAVLLPLIGAITALAVGRWPRRPQASRPAPIGPPA